MNVEHLITKARSMGLTLTVTGSDGLRVDGPSEARDVLRAELKSRKAELIEYLRRLPAGALVSHDGGLYLPWAAPLTPDDVMRMRAELIELIEDLAEGEGWPRRHLDEVLTRAIRGPLYDLLPNLAYFRERVAEFQAECEARALLAGRAWRADADLTRRGYSK